MNSAVSPSISNDRHKQPQQQQQQRRRFRRAPPTLPLPIPLPPPLPLQQNWQHPLREITVPEMIVAIFQCIFCYYCVLLLQTFVYQFINNFYVFLFFTSISLIIIFVIAQKNKLIKL